ncbi:MAG: metallophosphoesterase [Acidobacteriaceae bacterium]
MHRFLRSHIGFYLWLLTFIGCPLTSYGASSSLPQNSPQNQIAKPAQDHTIPALMVSDIHFDPFHDPAKLQQLVDAPVSRWNAILSASPSLKQKQAFADLQQSCHARGVDTSYTLLRSSLDAMRSRQPDAKFMTVSGDLLAHGFTCRYSTLLPRLTQSDYEEFVLKTIRFVLGELRQSFPGVPIYVALGNNDSACGDYRLDADSDFLARIGRIVAEGLPPSDRQQEMTEFAKNGSYSVTMAPLVQDTRFIVLDDLFLSSEYSTCSGKQNSTAANGEMTWLRDQLVQARRLGQKVWVMGHIPTGIDPYSTVMRFRNVCGRGRPVMFQSSSRLANLLIEYADVTRLGIFAHTHMDEIRLLEPENRKLHSSSGDSVAIKMIPSISPVDGNDPSFTVAYVNPATAMLRDYEVIAASNRTGIGTTWSREYDYARAYHQPQFSPSAVRKLVAGLQADPREKKKASQRYIRYYLIGDRSPELKPFWKQYVCALANYTAETYAACVCSITK